MPRTLTFPALAVLLAVSAAPADARPARTKVEPQLSAAIRTRQAAMDDFTARMGRLDALMGVPPATRAVRSRSAEAGR